MDDLSDEIEVAMGVVDVTVGDQTTRTSSAIFFLLCFIVVFSTVLFGAVDTTTWIIISLLWLSIVLLWLLDSWNAGGILFSSSSLQLPLVGLLIIGIVQLLPFSSGNAADALTISTSHALSLDPYSTRFFVTHLVVYLTFFACCLLVINNERRLKKAVLLIVIFGAGMAFFGILMRLSNPDAIYGLRQTPQSIPFGPFVNQHHFAAFMEMTAGMALAFLFGRGVARDRKLLVLIAVVVMGAAVVLTSSRGGLIGFFAVMALVLLLNVLTRESGKQGIQSKIAIAAAGIALIVTIFGLVLFLGGNESLFRGIGISNADTDISSGRSHYWPIAIQIFLQHPILGAGFDAFGVAFTQHDSWNGLLRVEQAHNDYLQTLADAGIAGFACVVAFIFLLFKKGISILSHAGNSLRRNSAIGALAGCFGVLIHSFFDFPLRTPSNAFFFLLLAAVATIPLHVQHDHEHRHKRPF